MKKRNHNNRNAFTMVEIIAVLVIVGLLTALAAKNITGAIAKARVKTTKANLVLLREAVLSFEMDTGRLPEDEEGLIVLVEQPPDVENWQVGGYLQTTELPEDGWGNEFDYQRNPPSGQPFVIISYGADNEEGGEDYNADLYSTDAK